MTESKKRADVEQVSLRIATSVMDAARVVAKRDLEPVSVVLRRWLRRGAELSEKAEA